MPRIESHSPNGNPSEQGKSRHTPELELVEGDITAIPSDLLLTAVTTEGPWDGGVDKALQRLTGQLGFHGKLGEATRAKGFREGDLVVVPTFFAMPMLEDPTNPGVLKEPNIPFGSVGFLADNLRRPLDEVIHAGLQRVDSYDGVSTVGHVTIPLMRTGRMAGQSPVTRTSEEAVDQLSRGIATFREQGAVNVDKITVVVYPGSAPTALNHAHLPTPVRLSQR